MITNFFLEFTIGIVKREKKLFWLVVLVGGGIEDDRHFFRHKDFCWILWRILILRIGEIFWCVKTVTTCEPGVVVEVEQRWVGRRHSLNDGQQWVVAGVSPSLRTQNLQENDLAP